MYVMNAIQPVRQYAGWVVFSISDHNEISRTSSAGRPLRSSYVRRRVGRVGGTFT